MPLPPPKKKYPTKIKTVKMVNQNELNVVAIEGFLGTLQAGRCYKLQATLQLTTVLLLPPRRWSYR